MRCGPCGGGRWSWKGWPEVEGSLVFLFAAFAVTWLAIVGYLVMLSGRLSALQRELEALRQRDPWPDPDPDPKPH